MRLRSAPGSDQTGFADASAVLDKLMSVMQDKGIHPEDMEIIDVKTSKEIPAKAFIDMAVHTKGLDVVKSAHASSNSKQEPFGSIYDAEIDKYVSEQVPYLQRPNTGYKKAVDDFVRLNPGKTEDDWKELSDIQQKKYLDKYKHLSEAPVNMPPYKNDDMSFVQGVYTTDQTGNKYSGQGPAINKGKIPGFNLEHELFQDEDGNINIFHSVDEYADNPQDFISKLKKFGRDTMIRKELHRKPLSFVSMRPFNDGYIVNSIASDPNARNKGIAKQLFLALTNYLGTPIYFGRQVSPQGKAFGDAMIKELEGQFRVVGFDQQTKQEFPVTDTDTLYNDPEGGQQLPDMQPKDIQKAITNTKLIKLIPEGYITPEAIIKEYLREAYTEQGLSQKQVASVIWDATNNKDTGIAFLDLLWDLPMANIKNRNLIIQNPDLAPARQGTGTRRPASYRVQDMFTINNWLKDQGLGRQIQVSEIQVDPTVPPKNGKNALKFSLIIDKKVVEVADQYSQSKYPNLKDFAVMIKKHTGHEKALEFYHTDWEHQNDANAEMLKSMGTDPLDLDTDTANEWLKAHSVPYRVRRMFNDAQYEIYFDLLSTLEPVGPTELH